MMNIEQNGFKDYPINYKREYTVLRCDLMRCQVKLEKI